MKTIGERIVFLREDREISQKELAEKVGITAASLSRYENNIYDPKGTIILSLAKHLNTSTDFLLGLTPNYNTDSAPSISSNEYRLLKTYRALAPANKVRVEERIYTLLETQSIKQ